MQNREIRTCSTQGKNRVFPKVRLQIYRSGKIVHCQPIA